MASSSFTLILLLNIAEILEGKDKADTAPGKGFNNKAPVPQKGSKRKNVAL
jgi:hypothetical protein